MSQWYYAKDRQRFGPVTLDQLLNLVASGQLTGTDMVLEEGTGQWLPAAQVAALAPESPTTDDLPVAKIRIPEKTLMERTVALARRKPTIAGLLAALLLLILILRVAVVKREAALPTPGQSAGVIGEIGDSVHYHNNTVRGLAFSPDGNLLASASWDKSLRIWDWKTRQHRATIDLKMGANEVAFSPDGQFLATTIGAWQAELPQAVRLLRTADWRDHVALADNDVGAHGVAFNSKGSLLAATRRDGSVRLWDVASGKVQATFQGTADICTCVAFSPREDVVVFGGKGGKLFEGSLRIKTHREIFTARKGIVSAAWSKDGNRLALGEWLLGEDGSSSARAIILDGKSYAQIAELPDHQTEASTVAFSADGKFLATVGAHGNGQGVALLWNATTGANLARWEFRYRTYAAAFHPDNQHLVVGDSKGQISIIRLP